MQVDKIKRKIEYKFKRACLDVINDFEDSDSENLIILARILKRTIKEIKKLIN